MLWLIDDVLMGPTLGPFVTMAAVLGLAFSAISVVMGGDGEDEDAE